MELGTSLSTLPFSGLIFLVIGKKRAGPLFGAKEIFS
jgi:hypothetical protein